MFWQQVEAEAERLGNWRIAKFARGTASGVALPVPGQAVRRLSAANEDWLWKVVENHYLNVWCIRQVSRIFREKVDKEWARQEFEALELEEVWEKAREVELWEEAQSWLNEGARRVVRGSDDGFIYIGNFDDDDGDDAELGEADSSSGEGRCWV